jgi:hypothetical protein
MLGLDLWQTCTQTLGGAFWVDMLAASDSVPACKVTVGCAALKLKLSKDVQACMGNSTMGVHRVTQSWWKGEEMEGPFDEGQGAQAGSAGLSVVVVGNSVPVTPTCLDGHRMLLEWVFVVCLFLRQQHHGSFVPQRAPKPHCKEQSDSSAVWKLNRHTN